MESTLSRLRTLMREYANLDEEFVISEETTILSICEDSMGVLEFAFEIEEEFDINISNAEKLVTVGDLIKVIDNA